MHSDLPLHTHIRISILSPSPSSTRPTIHLSSAAQKPFLARLIPRLAKCMFILALVYHFLSCTVDADAAIRREIQGQMRTDMQVQIQGQREMQREAGARAVYGIPGHVQIHSKNDPSIQAPEAHELPQSTAIGQLRIANRRARWFRPTPFEVEQHDESEGESEEIADENPVRGQEASGTVEDEDEAQISTSEREKRISRSRVARRPERYVVLAREEQRQVYEEG